MLFARRAIDRRAVLLMRSAAAAALILSVTPPFASAEVLDPLRGYAFDGTPVAPQKHREGENAKPGGESRESVRVRPAYVSTRTIRHIADKDGFKLTTQPHRYKHSYVANADDTGGHHFRLIFNAYNGQIVAQTDLGPDVSQSKTAESAAPAAPAKATAVTTAPAMPAPATPTSPASVATTPAPAASAPTAVVATSAQIPAAAAPPSAAVSTPAAPAASFAAVSPCEMAPAASAQKAVAEPTPPLAPATGTTDDRAANDRSEPYSAPTWDEVSGKASSDIGAPDPDATPGSPRVTGSIPPSPNKNSPPEPYWAPTWSEVSGQDAQPGKEP
jgi:hypothetical protein